MKAIKRIIFSAALTAAVASCAKDSFSGEEARKADPEFTFEAVYEGSSGTRTVLKDSTKVYWTPNDSIIIFYGSSTCGKFISTNTDTVAKTTFRGKFSQFDGDIEIGDTAKFFWAVYPYRDTEKCYGDSVTVTVPSDQTASEGTFGSDIFPSVARSTGLSLSFYNVCGGIMFTVDTVGITSIEFRGNNGEDIAGTAKIGMNESGKPEIGTFVSGEKTISVYAPGDSTFTPGKCYYLAAFPVSLTSGFSLTYNKNNYEGTFATSNSVAISRATFAILKDKNKGLTYTKKSVLGRANCFIISSYGQSSFNCRYKGNSTTPVGQIASAEVLWESFGTADTPSKGDVISDLTYDSSNRKITFKANKNGNAVVAVKDASGTILWSWHIWVCQGYDPDSTAHTYNNNAGTVMDRNLGATDTTKGSPLALGLLYQWGRKDPFLSSSSISSYTRANSTISSWPTVESTSEIGTIAYAVQNPTSFITHSGSEANYDWLYTGKRDVVDNTRWQTAKTIYDPCPEGWRVPDGGESGLWATASGCTAYGTCYSADNGWYADKHGVDCALTEKPLGSGKIWYPAGGGKDYAGNMVGFGKEGLYWSCTPCTTTPKYATLLYIGNTEVHTSIYPAHAGFARAHALSVRCMKEE